MQSTTLTLVLLLLTGLAGCGNDATAPEAGSGARAVGGGADPAAGGTAQAGTGHHGPGIELGRTTILGREVRASRDAGNVTPGGDVPVDVWVSGPRVEAVRFWIGLEDARGSEKALADLEDPNQTDHWHTHAMVPEPLPEGSRLWVQVQLDGQRGLGSFDLRR